MSNKFARPWFVPSFTSWISAGLLYLFIGAFGVASAVVLPILGELWEKSPRLGALAFLGYLSSPILLLAIMHHVTHGVMDRFDARKSPRGFFPGVECLWAGCTGWFAIVFASAAAAFVMLAIFPPPPEEGTLTAILQIATDVRLRAGLHTLVWIAIAAQIYSVEQAARKSRA